MDIVNFLKTQVFRISPYKNIKYYNLSKQFINTPIENVKDINSDLNSSPASNIYFIDGGLGLIFESNSCHVYKIKLACCLFNNNSLIQKEEHDFYLISYLSKENKSNKLKIRNQIFGETEVKELFKFNFDLFNDEKLFDREYFDFYDFDNLSKTGSLIMRLLELIYIRNLSSSNSTSGKKNIIVRDGSFEIKHKIEQDIFKRFSTNSLIFGMSKNSSFVDENGFNLSMRLINNFETNSNLILSDCFGYQEILNDINHYDKIEVYLIKLNIFAEQYFRCDFISKKDLTNVPNLKSEMISALNEIKLNAADNSVLGYPFGLVLADQIARISKRDVEYEKINLLYKDKELKQILENLSYNKQFHSVLDSLQY